MGFGTARPPVTEDIAEVIVKDIKSNEGHGLTSEVPMAFLTGGTRPPVDPLVVSQSRRQIMLFGVFAVVVLAILLTVWATA